LFWLQKMGRRKKVINDEKKVSVNSKKGKFQTVRGMRDILPNEQPYWQKVRRVAEKVAQEYGYQRIDTPVVEFKNLFEKGTGPGTDIVEKEMFVFKTKGGDNVCLRPEGTPSVARAYIQHGMRSLPKPVKLFYMGPMYRYERPQEGRYREMFQFGFEVFGEKDPILDAQLIQIASRIFKGIGIKKFSFQLNSIGCEECRPNYRKLLISYLNNRKNALCMDCKKRLKKNPLRVLDCKEEKCQQVISQAPQMIDHLCSDCKKHFTFLLECLDELEIQFNINPHLVRGLDYYTKTVFEIWPEGEEEGQVALGGGGRYDKLVETLGGTSTPAVGFACGMDRIVAEMKKREVKVNLSSQPKIFLVQLGDLAKKKSLKIFEQLESSGISVAESFGRGNLRSQLRQANQMKVDFVLIIGQREALDETIILKDMNSGSQEVITFSKVVSELKKRLKKLAEEKLNNSGKKNLKNIKLNSSSSAASKSFSKKRARTTKKKNKS